MYAPTSQPLFPPFRQSKPRKALKIVKEELEASSDIKDIKSQVDSSIKVYDDLHDNGQKEEKIVLKMDEREKLEELIHRDRLEKREMEEEEEKEKEEKEMKKEEALEEYDADYKEGKESLQEKTDCRRLVEEDSKKEKKLWSLKECDSFGSSITEENDIDEDYTETSEPLLAHPLQVLSKRFDLRTERERIEEEELSDNEIRNDLRESANRISGELMQMVENGVEPDRMIASLVLRLILEEIVLTIDFVDHGIDVHTFLTIATTIALRELKISWPGESNDRRFDENSESLFSPREKDIEEENSKDRRKSKIRSKLRGVRIPKLQTHDFLHRCLPWHLICPSHERGHVGGRFRGNLRDRVAEILGNRLIELERAYVPDVTCFHSKGRDMLQKGRRRRRRNVSQDEVKVSSSWKTGTDLVELPFYFFIFS